MPSRRVRSAVAESEPRLPLRSPSIVAIGVSRRGAGSRAAAAWLRRQFSIQATFGVSMRTWRKM